jgi:prophage regulatory protein
MEKIYRPADLPGVLNLSRSCIYALRQRGEFPAPIRLGAKAVGWPESLLQQWLDSRIDSRLDADTRAQKSQH